MSGCGELSMKCNLADSTNYREMEKAQINSKKKKKRSIKGEGQAKDHRSHPTTGQVPAHAQKLWVLPNRTAQTRTFNKHVTCST